MYEIESRGFVGGSFTRKLDTLRPPGRIHHAGKPADDDVDEASGRQANQDHGGGECTGTRHSIGRSGGSRMPACELNPPGGDIHPNRVSGRELAGEHCLCERVLEVLLNRALQWTCSVDGIESGLAQ